MYEEKGKNKRGVYTCTSTLTSQLVHKTSLSAVAFKTIANPFGQFSVKPQIVLSATPSSVPESPLPEISSEIILY